MTTPTSEPWDGDERRQDPLVPALQSIGDKLDALAARVEVAATLDERQRKLDRGLWWQKIIAGLQLVALVLVVVAAVNFANGKAHTQCEALNAANAKNAQFWHNILDKFPAIPPGPDATQSEKDRYAQSQAQTAAFVADVDELGRPQPCP